jgi:predicted transcriptional regulator
VSPRERDEETGQFSQQYDSEAFRDAIESIETPTTAKIAEWVGCSYDLAYRRLQDLETKGTVTKDDVGGSFVWGLAD